MKAVPVEKHAHKSGGGSSSSGGGLFGRFKKNSKKEEEHLAKTLSNQAAIDPSVKHSTDVRVHEALASLDPKKVLDAFWLAIRQDYPDNLILRFIRARKWDVDHSLLMFANSIEWRMKESHVDSLLHGGELECQRKGLDGVISQFKSGKCLIHGKDRRGRPLVIVRPRFHHKADQTPEEIEKFTLLMIEYSRLTLHEPVDSCTVIFDLQGFTMANMDYDPVKFMIKAFEAHYPESLGVLLIHRAPWIFNGIWKIVKNWLDPVVASKINFTKNISDLEKFIEKDQLMKFLDGDDDYEYEYLQPNEKDNGLAITDKEITEKLFLERSKLQEEFISKTIAWIETPDNETSKSLLQERLEIQRKLTDNYHSYDGAVRNRSIYDRLSVIKL